MSQNIGDILNTGVFYLEDAEEELLTLDRSRWCAHASAVCITAESLAITMEDGLWATLNERFDLLFDLYEEQEIEPDLLPAVADALEELLAPYADMEQIERVVAVSDGESIKAAVAGVVLIEQVRRVSAFLRDAAKAGKTVVASL